LPWATGTSTTGGGAAARPGVQSERSGTAGATFLACVNAGRPEAVTLARRLPADQVAQILLGNDAAKSGNWGQAVAMFRTLPRDGLMQLLQPLLLAWASQGSGANGSGAGDVAAAGGPSTLQIPRDFAQRP